jgi:hypothetical protein
MGQTWFVLYWGYGEDNGLLLLGVMSYTRYYEGLV